MNRGNNFFPKIITNKIKYTLSHFVYNKKQDVYKFNSNKV